MAEAQEKDNMWLWIGVIIAGIVLLAVLLKKDEVKHLEMKGATITDAQAQAALEKTKRLNNVFE